MMESSGRHGVDGTCESACAMAFLGGTTRYAPGGQLGVHQFTEDLSFPADFGDTAFQMGISQAQFINAMIVDYILELEIDPRVASIVANTPSSSMHYFTDQELLDLEINTLLPDESGWSLEAVGRGAVFTIEVQRDFTIESSTIFCAADRPDRAMILVSREIRGDLLELHNYIQGSTFFINQTEAGRIEGCPGCRVFSDQEGQGHLAVPLPNDIVDAMISGAHVKIEMEFPNAVGWRFEVETEFSRNEIRNVAHSLRNCI